MANYKTIAQQIDEKSGRPNPSKNIMDAMDYMYKNAEQSTTIAEALDQSNNETEEKEEEDNQGIK